MIETWNVQINEHIYFAYSKNKLRDQSSYHFQTIFFNYKVDSRYSKLTTGSLFYFLVTLFILQVSWAIGISFFYPRSWIDWTAWQTIQKSLAAEPCWRSESLFNRWMAFECPQHNVQNDLSSSFIGARNLERVQMSIVQLNRIHIRKALWRFFLPFFLPFRRCCIYSPTICSFKKR